MFEKTQGTPTELPRVDQTARKVLQRKLEERNNTGLKSSDFQNIKDLLGLHHSLVKEAWQSFLGDSPLGQEQVLQYSTHGIQDVVTDHEEWEVREFVLLGSTQENPLSKIAREQAELFREFNGFLLSAAENVDEYDTNLDEEYVDPKLIRHIDLDVAEVVPQFKHRSADPDLPVNVFTLQLPRESFRGFLQEPFEFHLMDAFEVSDVGRQSLPSATVRVTSTEENVSLMSMLLKEEKWKPLLKYFLLEAIQGAQNRRMLKLDQQIRVVAENKRKEQVTQSEHLARQSQLRFFELLKQELLKQQQSLELQIALGNARYTFPVAWDPEARAIVLKTVVRPLIDESIDEFYSEFKLTVKKIPIQLTTDGVQFKHLNQWQEEVPEGADQLAVLMNMLKAAHPSSQSLEEALAQTKTSLVVKN